MLMMMSASKIGGHAADQTRRKIESRRLKVVVIEGRPWLRSGSAGSHSGRALIQQEYHHVNQMNPSTRHHGIMLDVAAPTVGDFVLAAAKIVAIERVNFAGAVRSESLDVTICTRAQPATRDWNSVFGPRQATRS